MVRDLDHSKRPNSESYVLKISVFLSISSEMGMRVWYVVIALTLLTLSNRAPSAPQLAKAKSRMAADEVPHLSPQGVSQCGKMSGSRGAVAATSFA